MVNSWVEHVRKYAKDNSLSYMCAATDPECRSSYKARKDAVARSTKGMKTVKNRAKQSKKLFGELNVERLKRATPKPRAESPMFGMSPEMVRSSENRDLYPVINFDGASAYYQSALF